MTALRLAQGSILESRIQQLAEAWMIGTGVQITQHNGDVTLLLSGRQFPQTDNADNAPERNKYQIEKTI